MIIYLHGFCSSPRSEKARLLGQRMAERAMSDRFWCEQLPAGPRQAIEFVEGVLAKCPTPPALVGSSLGGYYAAYLAEKHDLRAVLINPAAFAYQSLAPAVGPQRNLYTGEPFEFTEWHLAELAELEVPRLSRPERFWLMVETGDEVLDYREAVEKYAGARQTVIEGGDHSFRHFADYLDAIIDFSLTP
ncbi:YqiA/YcfP family alpha/beta fold hydrolase [Methylococcus sp. ANG]|uniref:YqiA/YcfP family alpha/beta fold hydrolase n=1 Tax=unclassified Methylococcus TaxID=2618889 RepID=UPI001C52F922|nr:YqiA/YcfP family alpha/beta fold hydrolase [Methylococcus sp. Mc7]QXP84437.1 alpha/beta fold hydrolase [Methylococcus sp. Mc7]